MSDRHTVDTITSDALDALYDELANARQAFADVCGQRDRMRNRIAALATQWAVLRAYGSAATELRKALDQPQQPTLPGDHRTCCTARIGHHPTCRTNQQQPTTTEAPTR